MDNILSVKYLFLSQIPCDVAVAIVTVLLFSSKILIYRMLTFAHQFSVKIIPNGSDELKFLTDKPSLSLNFKRDSSYSSSNSIKHVFLQMIISVLHKLQHVINKNG